jgi:predicted Zn-ribbon and HTH transcriptional regulator
MTADQLQSIAMLLSRSGWVRHWLHFNYPQESPWLMAIDVRDHNNRPLELNGEMEKSGFTKTLEGVMDQTGECVIYTIARTNSDGTPYATNRYPAPGQCPKCGSQMIHTRLKGYQCRRCN